MDTNHRRNQHGPMPVAFFGIAVGSLALAGAWRAAARVWTLPHGLPALLTAGALAVWIALLVAYGHKWLTQRDAAIEEMRHPVQSSFADAPASVDDAHRASLAGLFARIRHRAIRDRRHRSAGASVRTCTDGSGRAAASPN